MPNRGNLLKSFSITNSVGNQIGLYEWRQ